MLKIHILNVDHGDSIVVEYICAKGNVYGVIDSNIPKGNKTPPALLKLQHLDVKKLSFVALTHPHADHFLGLPDILKTYEVATFYSFPLDQYLPGRLVKLRDIYKEIYSSTDSPSLRQTLVQFIELLHLVKEKIGDKNWEEPVGCNSPIYPEGFEGVDIKVLLPHPSNKGKYFEMIRNGDFNIATSPDLNSLSLAFQIKYKGVEIILGGDGDSSSWVSHKNTLLRGGISLSGRVIKLPHHGSKYDCTPSTFDHLFNPKQDCKIACISANGRSHPNSEIFEYIDSHNIHPYCTNLTELCRSNIKQIVNSDALEPVLNHFINLHEDSIGRAIQPCQGDIEITIEDDGTVNVSAEYPHECIFRGNYDFIFE